MLDVAIIGGGPAGLIAAEKLAEGGARVTLYERMPSLGRKFLMAGRGGLNLTHSEPFPTFLTRYGTLPPQLDAALNAFPPEALVKWAENLGETCFVGSSGRIFPKSFKASPLLRALLHRLETLGVSVRTRHEWRGWAENGALVFNTPDGMLEARHDCVLLALGGASWPRLGSDGGWLPILAAKGVEIAPLKPANSGIKVNWSEVFASRFAGQPVKRVRLSVNGHSASGEIMVTARGLEGGAVYALSSHLRAALESGHDQILVDLKPDLDATAIKVRLERPRRDETMTNFLRKSLNLSAVHIGLLREALGRDLPSEPYELAAALKALPLTMTGVEGLERAISTAGGVRFSQLDDGLQIKTMPGIFVAGEMLDWEAPTGGYLLQASFATGHAAARAILAKAR